MSAPPVSRAEEMFDQDLGRLARKLRRLADQVEKLRGERPAAVLADLEEETPNYRHVAQQAQREVLTAMSQLGLDELTSSSHEATKAAAARGATNIDILKRPGGGS